MYILLSHDQNSAHKSTATLTVQKNQASLTTNKNRLIAKTTSFSTVFWHHQPKHNKLKTAYGPNTHTKPHIKLKGATQHKTHQRDGNEEARDIEHLRGDRRVPERVADGLIIAEKAPFVRLAPQLKNQ
jgi:hypothetical protein